MLGLKPKPAMRTRLNVGSRHEVTMKIAGLILAGGEGRRMGGVDKGLQLFQGRPLVQHAIERLTPQVDALWISANRNVDMYMACGHPVFSDALPWRGLGPLAGIASFLAALPATYDVVQIVPCDVPFLPHDLTSSLLTGLGHADAIYPCSNETSHYACALVRRTCLQVAVQQIEHEQLSLHAWLSTCHAVALLGFKPSDLTNINTLVQLEPLKTEEKQ